MEAEGMIGYLHEKHVENTSKHTEKQKKDILSNMRLFERDGKEYYNFLLNNWDNFTLILIKKLPKSAFYSIPDNLSKKSNIDLLHKHNRILGDGSSNNFFNVGLRKIFPLFKQRLLSPKFLLFVVEKIHYTSYIGRFLDEYLPDQIVPYLNRKVVTERQLVHLFNKYPVEKLFYILYALVHFLNLIEKKVITIEEVEKFADYALNKLPKNMDHIAFSMELMLKMFLPLIENKKMSLDDFSKLFIAFVNKFNTNTHLFVENNRLIIELKKINPYIENNTVDVDFLIRLIRNIPRNTVYRLFLSLPKVLFIMHTKYVDEVKTEKFLVNICINLRKKSKKFIFLTHYDELPNEIVDLFLVKILPLILEHVNKGYLTLVEAEEFLLMIFKLYNDALLKVEEVLKKATPHINSKSDFRLLRDNVRYLLTFTPEKFEKLKNNSKNKVIELARVNKQEFWYHGSKAKGLKKLTRQKATAPTGRPKEEDLNAIYLSPKFDFSFACAIRPKGNTKINDIAKTIKFENGSAFDPNMKVYIYYFRPANIPDDKKTYIDPQQVVVDVDELVPDHVEELSAGDITKYYKILN